MFKQGILGMAAVFIGMALGYAYHFFMVRNLSPDIYGDLSLIIGILSILMVPTGSLQIILTREIAKLKNENKIRRLLKGYSKKIFAYSIIATVAFLILSYAIANVFRDSNLILPLQIIALSIPAAYLFAIARSYFQGKEKVKTLSALMVLEPLVKLIAAVILVRAGFGLIGATASLAIAPIIAIIIIYFMWKPPASSKIPDLKSNGSFLYILATNIILMLFLYIDLFAVKYFLGSEYAGFYNVANMTAKVIMYAVGGITLVFLPKTSKLDMRTDRKEIKALIIKSAALMLPAFIIFMLFPKEIISLFYTEKYLSALVPFRILTAGMFAYGLFTLLLNLSWSQKREKLPLALSFAVLVLDAVLLAYLVPVYGIVGASIATTASSAILLVALGIYAKQSI